MRKQNCVHGVKVVKRHAAIAGVGLVLLCWSPNMTVLASHVGLCLFLEGIAFLKHLDLDLV